MSSSGSDVLIIGGGIIGVACADELARRGVKVTLVERGRIGHGCSYANAGWITPCFALPLPMPGVLLKSIGWLLRADSPLYIKPRLSWSLFTWLTRFMAAATHKRMHASTAALTALAKFSLPAYRQLAQEAPGLTGYQERGLLMVSQTPDGLAAARGEMNLVAQYGIAGRALEAPEVCQLEPAIKPDSVLGGVYFPDEAHAEPLAMVRALAARARAAGATLLEGVEVFGFERGGSTTGSGDIKNIITTQGPLSASQYVLATGAWSPRVARTLNLHIPLLSGKGYAVTVDPLDPMPKIPLMLLERKLAITPRADGVRLAGTMELVDLDDSITARRVDAMVRGAQSFLSMPALPRIQEVWRGLRPCTPDGVPIIGRPARLGNLLIVAGHQMLGLLSAPGTARLAADLLTNSTPTFDPHPFRATRFG